MTRSLHAAVVLALTTAPALAGFRVEAPEYRPSVHPGDRQAHVGVPDDYQLMGNRRIEYIETTGQPPQTPVSGFGTAIPLDAALELIIPDRWLAYANPEIDAGLLVSWEESQTWIDALRGIAIRQQLRFFIDANKSVVRVEPMAPDSALIRLARYDPTTGNLLTEPAIADPDGYDPYALDADDMTDADIAASSAEVDNGADDSAPATAGADADTRPRPNTGTRGDAFTSEQANGPAFRNEVMTDADGMPVTYVYPKDDIAAREAGDLSETQDANTGPGQPVSHEHNVAPVDADRGDAGPVAAQVTQSAEIRTTLANEGLIAGSDDSRPWFYRVLPDGTRIRQLESTRHPDSSLTLTEYYAELLVINLRDATIADAIREISPAGWDVEFELSDGYLDDRTIERLITERPRGEVVSQLQKTLGVTITPYPIQNLVVVTDN